MFSKPSGILSRHVYSHQQPHKSSHNLQNHAAVELTASKYRVDGSSLLLSLTRFRR